MKMRLYGRRTAPKFRRGCKHILQMYFPIKAMVRLLLREDLTGFDAQNPTWGGTLRYENANIRRRVTPKRFLQGICLISHGLPSFFGVRLQSVSPPQTTSPSVMTLWSLLRRVDWIGFRTQNATWAGQPRAVQMNLYFNYTAT
jgi:hypothetical protein